MTLAQIVNILLIDFLKPVVPIIIGVALVVFLWGLAVFILNSGNEEKVAKGKNLMMYGIIGMFVMVSVWGLVKFLSDSFKDILPNPTGVVDVDVLRR